MLWFSMSGNWSQSRGLFDVLLGGMDLEASSSIMSPVSFPGFTLMN